MRDVHMAAASAGGELTILDLLRGGASLEAGLFTSELPHGSTPVTRGQTLLTRRVPPGAALSCRDKLATSCVNRDDHQHVQARPPQILRQLSATCGVERERSRKASSGENVPPVPANSTPSLSDPAQTPPSDVDLGPNLANAYRLLDAAARWIERMRAELGEMLNGIGKASERSFLHETQWAEDGAYLGGDGWVVNGWRWTYPARQRRRRVGTLSFIADICKAGRPALALGLPCILVVWSSAAHDWAPEIDDATNFWPLAEGTTRLASERLVQWTGEVPGNGPSDMLPLREGAWFYVAPLSALVDISKLGSLVVQPSLALLAGVPVDAAFANTPEVLRFSRRKGDLVMQS